MESRAKLLGHSIHQMLIVFPLGLLATAVVFDVIHLAGDQLLFAELAFWLVVSGLIGGAVAARFGLVDWLSIPRGTRAKRVDVYDRANLDAPSSLRAHDERPVHAG